MSHMFKINMKTDVREVDFENVWDWSGSGLPTQWQAMLLALKPGVLAGDVCLYHPYGLGYVWSSSVSEHGSEYSMVRC